MVPQVKPFIRQTKIGWPHTYVHIFQLANYLPKFSSRHTITFQKSLKLIFLRFSILSVPPLDVLENRKSPQNEPLYFLAFSKIVIKLGSPKESWLPAILSQNQLILTQAFRDSRDRSPA